MLSNQTRFSWFSVVSCLFPLKRFVSQYQSPLLFGRLSMFSWGNPPGYPNRWIFLCNFHDINGLVHEKFGFRTSDASSQTCQTWTYNWAEENRWVPCIAPRIQPLTAKKNPAADSSRWPLSTTTTRVVERFASGGSVCNGRMERRDGSGRWMCHVKHSS